MRSKQQDACCIAATCIDARQSRGAFRLRDRLRGNILIHDGADSEFSRQKSSSSALARQLIGVMTMPASWQAQCSVAAASQFCSNGDEMVAGLQADAVERCHQR